MKSSKLLMPVITPFPKCIEGHDFLTSKALLCHASSAVA